jgi:hypothetical protein
MVLVFMENQSEMRLKRCERIISPSNILFLLMPRISLLH